MHWQETGPKYWSKSYHVSKAHQFKHLWMGSNDSFSNQGTFPSLRYSDGLKKFHGSEEKYLEILKNTSKCGIFVIKKLFVYFHTFSKLYLFSIEPWKHWGKLFRKLISSKFVFFSSNGGTQKLVPRQWQQLTFLWLRSVAVIATTEIHSTKLKLKFCAGSNAASGVAETHDGKDLWQWFQLEINLNAFHQSTTP